MKRHAMFLCTLVAAAACKPYGLVTADVGVMEVYGAPSASAEILHGVELRVTLRTVGPGEYASPPDIVGESVAFLDVAYAAVQVPAGPTQVFRFVGTKPGRSIITFHNTGSSRVAVDTVIVD